MIERPVGFALLAAPFAWVAGKLLFTYPVTQVEVPVAIGIAALICLASAVLALEPVSWVGWPNLGLLAGLLVAGAIAATEPGSYGAVGPEIAAGVLIGVPWILVGYTARTQEPLGLRFVAYGGAVTWGLLLLADGSSLHGANGTAETSGFLSNFLSLATQQGQVFGNLLTGGPAPTLPLNPVFDVGYAALTAVSVVGLLLGSARPQTGAQAPLPVAVRSFRDPSSDRELSASYDFSPMQREVFRERSPSDSPLLTWPPGLEPVFYGAAAAGIFLLVAYFAPSWAVLAATVAFGVGLLLLVRLTEIPLPIAEPRRRAAATPPAEPAEPAREPSDPINTVMAGTDPTAETSS
jgi:hypothetical protein